MALHLGEKDLPLATLCGMSGVFSALFGTPLTATLFAMMVVDVGLMLTVAFVPGFLAALIAYGISLADVKARHHFAALEAHAQGQHRKHHFAHKVPRQGLPQLNGIYNDSHARTVIAAHPHHWR